MNRISHRHRHRHRTVTVAEQGRRVWVVLVRAGHEGSVPRGGSVLIVQPLAIVGLVKSSAKKGESLYEVHTGWTTM